MRAIKIVVVGDGAVGKTALLVRYTENIFSSDYIPTVSDHYARNTQLDGQLTSMQLWDTPGQDDYDRMRPMLYQGAEAFVLCFSARSRVSFDNAHTKWIGEIRHNCPNVPVILVATKIDLRRHELLEPAISKKEGEELSVRIGAYKYLESSSQTGEGVNEVFNEAARAHFSPQMNKVRKGKKHKCIVL